MDERIDAVQRMQDYIEINPEQDISMADLSKAAGYFPWYSSRLFHCLLHMTPAVYIRRLRLSKSALRLRDEKVKIIDVVYDSGFESMDGYQRAFYKEFGCTPYAYSVNPMPIYLFKPYSIKYTKRKDSSQMSEAKVFLFRSQKRQPAGFRCPTGCNYQPDPFSVFLRKGHSCTDYQEVGCPKGKRCHPGVRPCGARNSIFCTFCCY